LRVKVFIAQRQSPAQSIFHLRFLFYYSGKSAGLNAVQRNSE
jgi:hypothetical protein